jgi:hypothetical protein
MSGYELDKLKAGGANVVRTAADYKSCSDAIVSNNGKAYNLSVESTRSADYEKELAEWTKVSTEFAQNNEGKDLTDYNSINSQVNDAARDVYYARRAVQNMNLKTTS